MSVVLPFTYERTMYCPACGSVGIEYHPSERFGRCHQCGFTWKLTKGVRP